MLTRFVERGLLRLRSNDAIAALLRGTATSFLVNTLAMGVGFLAQLILARTLGAGQFGIFAYVTSWIGVSVLFATLGIDTMLLRYVPQYRVTSDWPRLLGVLRWSRNVSLIAGIVVAALLAAAVLIAGDRIAPAVANTFLLGALAVPLWAWGAVNQAALRGFRLAGSSSVPLILMRPLLLSAGVLAVAQLTPGRLGAPGAMLLNGLALAIAMATASRWLRRAVPAAARTAAPWFEGRAWTRVSAPMFIMSGTNVILQETDVILVGLVIGTTEAGVYAVAVRLARLMTFGLAASSAIVGPLISELYTQRDFARLRSTTRLASLLALAGALVIGGLLLGARWLALDLFGPDFRAGADVVLILALGQLFNAATGPVGAMLNMTGHQDANARLCGIVACVNVIAIYPATKLWGIEGAAVVTSSMIALKNIWTWFEVRRRLALDATTMNPAAPTDAGSEAVLSAAARAA